jgi:CheY-like chemotaxis protein
VYGVVKQSRGFIHTDSAVGQGTTFIVHLPCVDADVATAECLPPPPVSDRGTETILLVEDEDDVRVLARQILTARGYTVLEAIDGVGAMEVTARHAGPIQLLLTDVVMPRMNGRELADRLVPLRPEMKVVYISGYADEILRTDTRQTIVLEKPVSASTLAGTVREVLDAGVQRA